MRRAPWSMSISERKPRLPERKARGSGRAREDGTLEWKVDAIWQPSP
jgi:hypothetical protein